MKRFFAIFLVATLLLAMLLTACSEKGEVVIEDVTTTEAVAEEVTTVTTEETTVSMTETEAEETTVETTIETTVATTEETEGNTTAEINSEISVEPKLAQHEDLIGAWTFDNEVFFVFEEDRYVEFYGNSITAINDKVKDGKLTFPENFSVTPDVIAYFRGEALHCEMTSDDELPSIPLARYNQPAISADFWDGKWYSDSYSEAGLWDWGWFSFENGTGIFEYGEGDKANLNADISVIGDKILFIVGDYSSEYTYYTVDYPNVYRKHIYLLGEENDIVLTQHY